jgi:hypothetical protein
MRRINRKLLLSAAAIVVGIGAAAVRAQAIESASFVIDPISLWGSYGGGTTASTNYRITMSWTGISGRVYSSSRRACLGFLCHGTGASIFAPATLNDYP